MHFTNSIKNLISARFTSERHHSKVFQHCFCNWSEKVLFVFSADRGGSHAGEKMVFQEKEKRRRAFLPISKKLWPCMRGGKMTPQYKRHSFCQTQSERCEEKNSSLYFQQWKKFLCSEHLICVRENDIRDGCSSVGYFDWICLRATFQTKCGNFPTWADSPSIIHLGVESQRYGVLDFRRCIVELVWR